MTQKKRLMVVVGAGASIDLGMPSVGEVDRLFCEWSLEGFKLAEDNRKTLYSYIRDKINLHYAKNPKGGLVTTTNFEEVLYVILQLSAALTDSNFDRPINALFHIEELPRIVSYSGLKAADGNDLRYLANTLIDKLLEEFRRRCVVASTEKAAAFEQVSTFLRQLCNDFEVAFITTNYDNLILQAVPDLFTGFDDTGSFNPFSVYTRQKWGLVYYLHGSVHFDMQGHDLDIHAIKWNPNLDSEFQSNALGRNSQDTMEGIEMPTSSIVAGYGKTSQIQRVPFRTYYSQIDAVAEMADAYLFIGYGFSDLHLNNCFHTIRNTPKPVVVITKAGEGEDPMQARHDEWTWNLNRAVPFNPAQMATKQYRHIAPDIDELIANDEFEISTNPKYPLSIWHGGVMNACSNYQKIKDELG